MDDYNVHIFDQSYFIGYIISPTYILQLLHGKYFIKNASLARHSICLTRDGAVERGFVEGWGTSDSTYIVPMWTGKYYIFTITLVY